MLLCLIASWALVPGLHSRTPILTYHDVIESRDASSLWFDCAAKELEQQLTWLEKQGAHFVSVTQIYEHLAKGKKLPPKSIAVTFADGYEGFYSLGLPVLRRHGVPVAMFVHTDYVGDQHNRPKMNWEQLKELDREGLVTICSQTRTHPADLRTLKTPALTEEMAGSKKSLELHLGHPVRFLAYPNGKYDERVARAAAKAGYEMAFTEQLRPCETSPNLYMISRYVHTKYRQAWHDAYRQ